MTLTSLRRLVLLFAFASLSACAQTKPGELDAALACLPPDGTAAAAELPHNFSAPVPIHYEPAAHTPGTTRVVYLNRAARSYVAGTDDAQAGSSSVLSSQHIASAALGGFQQGDDAWQGLVECVRDQFSAFDIAITDVRPVEPGYVEAHFGGKGPEIGITTGSSGIAPIDNEHCGVVESGIVFVFSDLFGDDLRSVCEIGAHEIGHVFSLDHEFRCKDPMTYVEGCGDKDFQPMDTPCGEDAPRACICGRASQNSVSILYSQLGDHRSDVTPPAVELLAPVADPAGAGTYLQVRATDETAISAIELHVVEDGVESVSVCGDDTLPCTLDGELASFALPPQTKDAQIWAVGEDTGGNRTATQEVDVRAGAGATTPLSLAVAPVASSYPANSIVEIEALVVASAPLASVVAVWTNADGSQTEIPLCPRSDIAGANLRYGVSVHLGTGNAMRNFHISATDTAGHSVASQDQPVTVAS
jgi:hypothetical protein